MTHNNSVARERSTGKQYYPMYPPQGNLILTCSVHIVKGANDALLAMLAKIEEKLDIIGGQLQAAKQPQFVANQYPTAVNQRVDMSELRGQSSDAVKLQKLKILREHQFYQCISDL